MQPTVFIGSSKEGLEVARAIRNQLNEIAEVTIWNESGVFQLGHGYLESLVDALQGFDFAILVLSADDSIESRGVTSFAPRDNVMFELGLFMGKLGRKRTFAICDESQKVKLPSDLAGVSLAGYTSRQDGNLVAAVGAATDRIRNVIRTLGIHEARASQQLQSSVTWNSHEHPFYDAGLHLKNIGQEKADIYCRSKYQDLVKEGTLPNSNCHVWAHLEAGQCVYNN